jgi:hypothetical protein
VLTGACPGVSSMRQDGQRPCVTCPSARAVGGGQQVHMAIAPTHSRAWAPVAPRSRTRPYRLLPSGTG